jgi:hypothetical protein
MKRPTNPNLWQPAEVRIVEDVVRDLLAGGRATLREATSECLLRLRRWYAARPGAPKSDRVYPRSFAAVWNRLHKVAVALGFRKSHTLWTPPERRLAYKWARTYLRHRHKGPLLQRRDAARGLLVDLAVAGYDRTLKSCYFELAKCEKDAARGEPRHCGRGPAAVALPAAVLRATRGRRAGVRRFD